MSAARIAVIGIGSPAGDDRAGWLTVQALKAHTLPIGVALHLRDRPGPALLEALAHLDAAVLVDAMVGGEPAGTVHRLELRDAPALPGTPVSSHGFGLGETLALGAALGRLPPAVVLYAIEGADFIPESPASPAVARAAADCAARIAAELRVLTGATA